MSEKRVCVPLAEKKSYAEMIVKGASRSTVSEIYRKKHGTELPERTFRRWKTDSKSILEAKSKLKFQQSRNKSSSMEQVVKKIKEEYQKRKIKLKKRGVTAFNLHPMLQKNNSKSQAYLNDCRKYCAKIKCHLKTGLSLENLRMTDFDEISQNRP